MSGPTDSKSDPYYFISYSRQEITFVDSLSQALTKRGIQNWVDFRNLVPGQAWQTQLDEGVKNAAAVLLVASRASMASGPVKDELKKSIAAGKRIITLIFEPCDLDSSLAEREWVNFTVDFDNAVNLLASLLSQPEKKMPVLRSGKGVAPPPKGVNAFFPIGLLVLFLSFAAVIGGTSTAISDSLFLNVEALSRLFETFNPTLALMVFVFIPAVWNFVQFLWRVRFRAHNAAKMRNSIYGLFIINLIPFVIGVGAYLGVQGIKPVDGRWAFWLSLPSLVACIYLYRLLISDPMYRWAGPTGAIIRAPRPDLTKHMDNKGTQVAIEHAPQDETYAKALEASIVKAGHTCTDNLQNAEVVLTLLSAYQNRSSCDPQEKLVIPILLQSFNDIDDGSENTFSQLQWVDLRYGQISMDAVANLLDEPEGLQRVLGVLPVRTPILPGGVNLLVSVMSFILAYSTIFSVVWILMGLLASSAGETSGLKFSDYLALLFIGTLYILRSYIVQRRFWLVKKRVKRFYESRRSRPIWRNLIPQMEKQTLFVKIEEYMNTKFGKVEFSYGWVLGFAVLVSVIATVAYWGLPFFFLPVWLIPLFMLRKEIKLWLPRKVTQARGAFVGSEGHASQ